MNFGNNVAITLEELGANQPIKRSTYAEPEASTACDPRPGFGWLSWDDL